MSLGATKAPRAAPTRCRAESGSAASTACRRATGCPLRAMIISSSRCSSISEMSRDKCVFASSMFTCFILTKLSQNGGSCQGYWSCSGRVLLRRARTLYAGGRHYNSPRQPATAGPPPAPDAPPGGKALIRRAASGSVTSAGPAGRLSRLPGSYSSSLAVANRGRLQPRFCIRIPREISRQVQVEYYAPLSRWSRFDCG